VPRHSLTLLGFDDLSPEDEWESPARTVTEADVLNFAGFSGDFNPLHVDHEAAKAGPFRKPVAHGLLGLAMASGLSSHAPRVDTLALLAVLEWKCLKPIAIGDTVHVISRVISLESRGRGRRGVVTWQRRLVNQDGATVQEGFTQTLVRARSTDQTGTES
jgi:acyl dehydratase